MYDGMLFTSCKNLIVDNYIEKVQMKMHDLSRDLTPILFDGRSNAVGFVQAMDCNHPHAQLSQKDGEVNKKSHELINSIKIHAIIKYTI